jgi:hypothetical protein
MSNKAFTAHRHNGVYLELPNGNCISTIWGSGTYSDNHDNFGSFNTLIEMGSDTVEIMVKTTNDKLRNEIYHHMKQDPKGDTVIGWVGITDWLWIVNRLANAKPTEKATP